MTLLLWPRMSADVAHKIFTEYGGRSVEDIAREAGKHGRHPRVTFAATGGARLSIEREQALCNSVREVARLWGYPGEPTLEGKQRFDREVSVLLNGSELPRGGEGLRAETWQYLAAGLLPDVVVWRWRGNDGDVVPERYLGGNRNCFGRLWLRSQVFYEPRLADPFLLIRLLLEDNFVAILERSAFAAQPAPCRAVARAFVLRRSLVKGKGDSPEQTLLRDAMRRLIRIAGYSAIWSLDGHELQLLAGRVFDLSMTTLFGVLPIDDAELVQRQPSLALTNEPVVGAATTAIPGGAPMAGPPNRSPGRLLNALIKLDKNLGAPVCAGCGRAAHLAIREELPTGVVISCDLGCPTKSVPTQLLQRLVDSVEGRCFDCGGALVATTSRVGGFLKCTGCTRANSWARLSERLEGAPRPDAD